MIVGLDIDGVLADSVTEFLDLLNILYRGNWNLSDVTTYRFDEALGLSGKQVEHFWKLFARQGRWSKIKPFAGAIKLTQALALEHAIVLITGRPRHYVEVETKAWLRRHKFCYDDLLFLGKFNKLDASVDAGYKLDVFVEDSYEYSRPLADAGVPILLMDYPYNRNVPDHPYIKRIKSLAEAYDCIDQMQKDENGAPAHEPSGK